MMLAEELRSTEFGATLRALRLAAALSQNRLARASGIDPAYVNRIERGVPGSAIGIRRPIVLRMAHVLNERLAVLRDEQDERAAADLRDELLVAAGYAPQPIVDAGGWAAFRASLRESVLESVQATLHSIDVIIYERRSRP
jgi:transcriptional regulator with XRE-family HTH domain